MTQYLTIREAWKYLQIPEWTLRKLVKTGILETVRVHRNTFPDSHRSGMPLEVLAIRKDDIEIYLNTLKPVMCKNCHGSGLAENGERCARC